MAKTYLKLPIQIESKNSNEKMYGVYDAQINPSRPQYLRMMASRPERDAKSPAQIIYEARGKREPIITTDESKQAMQTPEGVEASRSMMGGLVDEDPRNVVMAVPENPTPQFIEIPPENYDYYSGQRSRFSEYPIEGQENVKRYSPKTNRWYNYEDEDDQGREVQIQSSFDPYTKNMGPSQYRAFCQPDRFGSPSSRVLGRKPVRIYEAEPRAYTLSPGVDYENKEQYDHNLQQRPRYSTPVEGHPQTYNAPTPYGTKRYSTPVAYNQAVEGAFRPIAHFNNAPDGVNYNQGMMMEQGQEGGHMLNVPPYGTNRYSTPVAYNQAVEGSYKPIVHCNNAPDGLNYNQGMMMEQGQEGGHMLNAPPHGTNRYSTPVAYNQAVEGAYKPIVHCNNAPDGLNYNQGMMMQQGQEGGHMLNAPNLPDFYIPPPIVTYIDPNKEDADLKQVAPQSGKEGDLGEDAQDLIKEFNEISNQLKSLSRLTSQD